MSDDSELVFWGGKVGLHWKTSANFSGHTLKMGNYRMVTVWRLPTGWAYCSYNQPGVTTKKNTEQEAKDALVDAVLKLMLGGDE